jgi:hypothetical protein
MCNNPSSFFLKSQAIVLFYTPPTHYERSLRPILSELLLLTAKLVQGADPMSGAVKSYNPYKRVNFEGEDQAETWFPRFTCSCTYFFKYEKKTIFFFENFSFI